MTEQMVGQPEDCNPNPVSDFAGSRSSIAVPTPKTYFKPSWTHPPRGPPPDRHTGRDEPQTIGPTKTADRAPSTTHQPLVWRMLVSRLGVGCRWRGLCPGSGLAATPFSIQASFWRAIPLVSGHLNLSRCACPAQGRRRCGRCLPVAAVLHDNS
jgi:hypothetical protein